jgi:hypothetical protein
MRPSVLESVIVTEFQAAGTYSSLDLTKTKYGINNNNNNNKIGSTMASIKYDSKKQFKF